MEHLFSPYSSIDLRSDAHQSQIIRGDAGEDHTQSAGGDTLKIFGGDISPLPPEFRYHCVPRGSFLFLLGSAMEQNTFFSADKKVCALRIQKDLPIIKTPCDAASIL